MTNVYLEKVAKSGFWTAVDKVSRGAEKGINAVGSGYQKAMKSKPIVAFNTMGKNKQTAVMAGVGAGAGLGVRTLTKKKVDDPAMTKVANIYLEKIAEDKELSATRVLGRSAVTGVLGAIGGGAAGGLLTRSPQGMAVGKLVGGIFGAVHGAKKSMRNQKREQRLAGL